MKPKETPEPSHYPTKPQETHDDQNAKCTVKGQLKNSTSNCKLWFSNRVSISTPGAGEQSNVGLKETLSSWKSFLCLKSGPQSNYACNTDNRGKKRVFFLFNYFIIVFSFTLLVANIVCVVHVVASLPGLPAFVLGTKVKKQIKITAGNIHRGMELKRDFRHVGLLLLLITLLITLLESTANQARHTFPRADPTRGTWMPIKHPPLVRQTTCNWKHHRF